MPSSMLECLESSLPVGEKFKKLNQISKQLTPIQVDKILEELKAASHYDRIRLKLADDFKRSSCVLDILKNGDKQSITRAVKLPWMYADESDLINAEFLVKTLFPLISFSTRLKIINNLGKYLRNPQVADHIFNTIESKYGFKIASAMLPSCSEEVIINYLVGERHHELSSTQLLILVKTSPHVGLRYLRELENVVINKYHDFSSSFMYLIDHYTSETMSLLLEHPNIWNCKLGQRRSKKLLSIHTEKLEGLMSEKYDFIKLNQLRKFLSPQQYEKAFLKYVKKSNLLSSFYAIDDLWKWLDHLPKSRKLSLLRNAFRMNFNKEITQCPQHVTHDMLVLLPYEERLAIIAWKVEHDDLCGVTCRNFKWVQYVYSSVERFWIALKPTSCSIPELTKILNLERDCKKRADLFKFLVMTCIYNKDAKELTAVLQLLTKKCRNDQREVRQAFLEIMDDATSHIEFKEDHWACFQELLQFLQLYKEVTSLNALLVVELLGKYSLYLCNCKKAYDAELSTIIKISATSELCFDISHIKSPHAKLEIIEGYVRVLSAEAEDSIWDEYGKYIIDFVREISEWNQHRSNYAVIVSNFPWLEKRCWEMMTKKKLGNTVFDVTQRINAFKVLKKGSNFDGDAFDKMLSNIICGPALHLCLKEHPEKIFNNAENIVLNILKVENMREFHSYFLFMQKLRATYCWELVDRVKEECRKIINHTRPKSVSMEIGYAIRLFAILDPSEFLNLASKHHPVEAKIDTSIPIDEVDYRIKESIAGSLKHLPDVKLCLPVVDRYLVGDYLKLTLASLYSACLAAPETEVLVYLRSQLHDRPVSVKKHIVRLFFLMSPLGGKCKVLEELWLNAKNPSLRYEIFTQICHLFKEIPREEEWNLLISTIESLTDEDTPCSDFIKNSTSLDRYLGEFSSKYFQVILETFKRIGIYEKSEGQIISRILSVISQLNGHFLDSLIQALLPKPKLSEIYTYSQLASSYLLDESISMELRTHRLNLLQSIIQDLFDNRWDVTELQFDNTADKLAFPTRRLLSEICNSVCTQLLDLRGKNKDVNRKEVLQRLIEQFKGVTDISKTFKNLVYMQITIVALDNMELEDFDWLKSFGHDVAPCLSLFAQKYGGETICVTSAILLDLAKRMLTNMDEENLIRIIDGLLSNKEINKYHLITAIFLLPQYSPNSDELSQMHKRITDIIKNCPDTTAHIYFKLKENDDDWRCLLS